MLTTKPTVDTPFHVQVIKCKNYDHNTKYEFAGNAIAQFKRDAEHLSLSFYLLF